MGTQTEQYFYLSPIISSSISDKPFAISLTALLADSIIVETEAVQDVHTEGRLEILYQPFCVEVQFAPASLPVAVQKLF